MNRQIKFRGKRTDNGAWVWGFYAELPIEIESGGLPDNKKHFIFNLNRLDRPPIEVIPETVGQFTGLCEKNGKEIYEGDILSLVASNGVKINVACRFGSAYRIMRDANALCDIVGFYFEHTNRAKSFPMVCNYKGLHDTEIMEIIGNIHDNEDLFTAK